ncbi:CXXC motif containing zinc binding protein isoform X2 [Lycorma delicatula]|uniref:CXXC motif containing zinc binding protein isoform X2 n=1 Tax=Lycorma delicatula TaxID=130591 RepID=UPI003F5105EA
MVVFSLNVNCNFEGIKLLYVDASEYEWCLKVKCSGCGEESPNWHTFTANDHCPLKGGRGSANFLYKYIIEDSLKKIELIEGDRFLPLVRFDCRGLEPVSFQPKGSWTAISENSEAVFTDIDLSENDWVDYDTNAQETVGIYDFKSKFERVK